MGKNPPETPLKWRRFIVGKTQLELFVETGVNQGRISAFERGLLKPRPDERRALAKALKIDVDKLVFPTDEKAA
jgi:transcriptional regulator with XRE-family HTH domain